MHTTSAALQNRFLRVLWLWLWMAWAASFLPFRGVQAMATPTAPTLNGIQPQPRIAIIGAGAAGLACSRVFSREQGFCDTLVLEQRNNVGGVWNYQRQSKERPMYAGLRTNLPKEIMAYRTFPWYKEEHDSFLTHMQVQQYLEHYKERFDIQVLFGKKVLHLKVLDGDDADQSCFSPSRDSGSSGEDMWPKVQLTIADTANEGHAVQETFDAILVANGHYAQPSIPELEGIEHFLSAGGNKRVLHSVEYDTPEDFKSQSVLCIGGRASGSDIAREVAAAGAKQVYVSDSARTTGEPRSLGPITWVPKTTRILPNGSAEFDLDCPIHAEVDTIIFCTGYDYSFPFITSESGLELDPSNRRVTPLYEQLWHARYPHIAFIGLPHSVLPFPFFEFQAEACLNMWRTQRLPSLSEREAAALHDASSGGEGKKAGRIKDTHYLGDAQWDYCRRMAKYGGFYDDNVEQYLKVNKEMYDHAGKYRNAGFPGGPDDYRKIRYKRDPHTQSWQRVDSTAAVVDQ